MIVIISAGTDINAQDNIGNTPLHILVNQRNSISKETFLALVRLLIQNGARRVTQNSSGQSALDSFGNTIEELLLKKDTMISIVEVLKSRP